MTINYAMFKNPDQADQAYVDLLERGASPSDLIVITRSSYKDESARREDGRLQPSEEAIEPAPEVPDFTNAMTAEALLGGHNTVHFSPGRARIFESLRFPGDLANALKEIGFTYADAESIEASVLHGGGFLIVMTPSGSLDENQMGEVINQRGGQALTHSHGDAYAG
jgi:hypothetical protein